MGRAYRYQRRLTHIVLSVAERGGSASLVTKVEEPVAVAAEAPSKPAKTGKAKTAAKPKAAPKAEAKKPAAKKSAPKKHAK
jgi:large subunit ribosomal protein L22